MKKRKKHKKGQMGMGALIVVFIGIIVGLTLFLTTSQTLGSYTETIAVANKSLTASASNSTTIYLTDYRSISDVVIYNGSGAGLAIVPSTNYTVTNNVVYNGQEAVSVLPASAAIHNYTGNQWNISGTAEPVGYIGGSSRAIALLIPIFAALAIALLALVPTFKEGVLDLIKG